MEGNTFYLVFEPGLMIALQEIMNPFMTAVASLVTMLGEEYLLVAILGFVYWSFDKEYGKYIGLNVVTGLLINPMLKNIALRRRPYFDHSEIACLRAVDAEADLYDITAQGYSFPSGHSSNSAIIYGSLARYKGRRAGTALKVIAFAVPFLVGLSRVMLGVHYPTDVLCGWALGALIVFLIPFLYEKIGRNRLYVLLFLAALPGLFYCTTKDYYTGLGIMAGFFLAVPFEEKFVHFENTRRVPFMILRLVGGFAVYFGLNTVLKIPVRALVPEDAQTAQLIARAIRYAIVLFVMIGVYPMLFRMVEKRGKTETAKGGTL